MDINEAPHMNGTEESEALPPGHMRLATGVVLEVVEASIFAIEKVQRRLIAQEPKPPMVMSRDEAHQEPNESDPEYQKQMLIYKADLTEKTYEIALATGTRIVSLPEGFPTPESEEWSNDLAEFQIEVAQKNPFRYADWIKYVAGKGPTDFARLLKAVMMGVGTTEKEVAEALETFPGVAPRGIPDTANRP